MPVTTDAGQAAGAGSGAPYNLNVPLDRDDVEALRVLATESDRSLRAYVRHLIRAHLATAA